MTNYKINDDFYSKNLNEECYILNIVDDSEHVFVLKGVSIDFWDLINDDRPPSEIVDSIVNEYEVSKEQAEKDFKDFINSLKDKKVLL